MTRRRALSGAPVSGVPTTPTTPTRHHLTTRRRVTTRGALHGAPVDDVRVATRTRTTTRPKSTWVSSPSPFTSPTPARASWRGTSGTYSRPTAAARVGDRDPRTAQTAASAWPCRSSSSVSTAARSTSAAKPASGARSAWRSPSRSCEIRRWRTTPPTDGPRARARRTTDATNATTSHLTRRRPRFTTAVIPDGTASVESGSGPRRLRIYSPRRSTPAPTPGTSRIFARTSRGAKCGAATDRTARRGSTCAGRAGRASGRPSRLVPRRPPRTKRRTRSTRAASPPTTRTRCGWNDRGACSSWTTIGWFAWSSPRCSGAWTRFA
mmetsp:Transcript_8133/g.33391  ORF Transcript_8133/g.33391 Transcript_8133/m.33391 type:complete len:323 (+) Transcript_8133:1658-2626(+)